MAKYSEQDIHSNRPKKSKIRKFKQFYDEEFNRDDHWELKKQRKKPWKKKRTTREDYPSPDENR